MAKSILNNLFKSVIIIVAYMLQLFVINNTLFFGVSGDLCLCLLVTLILISSNTSAYIYSVLLGILSDILFFDVFGKHIVIYVLITAVLIECKKIYKQESKFSIIIFTLVAVLISEMFVYIFYIFKERILLNIFSVILLIIKESLINICLSFILYIICKRILLENKL